MDKLVKKILVEWSYRVDDGMINTESYTHLGILREILSELDLPTDFIMEFMGNLTEEQTFKARSKETNKIVYYKSKENMEKAIKDGTAIPLDKETSDEPEKVKGQDMFAKDLEDTKIKPGEPNQKDKLLDTKINPKESEVFKNKETGITDDDFERQDVIKSSVEDSEDELKLEQIEKFFDSGKIPKKYAKVITRLMNSQKLNKREPSILNFIKGVGAGELQAQSGEIITMVSMGMNDKEFEEFISVLELQTEKYQKGSKPIVTKDWLDSVKAVRTINKKRYDKMCGKGKWDIENTAWDVKEEFEALGNSDYKKNKGFSSDMYVRLNCDGKIKLDEISLKKDSTANIYNGVVTDIENWFGDEKVPDKANIKIYKEKELERVLEYGSKAKKIEMDRTKLISGEILNKENKTLRSTLSATGMIKKQGKDWIVTPGSEKIIKKLESMEIPPQIDSDRIKEVFGTKDKTRVKKYLIMHAAMNAVNGDEIAKDFLNRHIGYDRDEDGKFPEGSIKRYQNDTIQSLVESDNAKKSLLDALSEKLPLKSLISGEENMSIGGLSADKETLKQVFGIDNFKQFRAGLNVKEDEDGNNYLIYESKKPSKSVKISEVQVRQKGLGYASSVGLEFKIAKDFAKNLYDANKEIYPPAPDITDKEKRKLGIN